MTATMTQIAKEAGVTVAVVSRFLRGDPELRISHQRQQEILLARDRLGGIKVRRPKRRLTRTILIPVERSFSPAWAHSHLAGTEILQTLETTLQEQGFRAHFIFFDNETKQKTFENLIKSRNDCDGLVILSRVMDEAMADLLRLCEFPHVCLDYQAERYRVNTVVAHMSDGIRQAAEHLYHLGHRKIGYMGVRAALRYPTTISALAALELPIDEDLHCWVTPIEPKEEECLWTTRAQEAFGALLDHGTQTTAFICHTDRIALGALAAMKERHLVPGREISIVGYDNIEVHGAERPEMPILTTVDNPMALIGQRAAEWLLSQILHGQQQIIHERVPTSLIVRTTTGPGPWKR